MAKERFRLQFKFWLDVNKPDEYALAEIIADLKESKTFSKVIRDGIRLIWSLGQGNLDVLLALFPWIEDAFYERFKEREPASDSALQQQLARLEKLLIEQGSVPIDQVPKGPKPLMMSPVPEKVDDEDDSALLTLKKTASVSKQASANFLASAFSLQEG